MNVLHGNGIARGGSLLLACAAIAFEGGCAARLYAEPGQAPAPVVDDGVVYVDTVPANIEVYPHYYYGDGYAYYVDGRWYHRGARGWGYYRQEPAELQVQRQRAYVQQAPAPVRERPYVQQAPEAPRERRPYVQQAPGPGRERPDVQQAPAAPRASPGVVEAQPRRPDSRRAPPSEKRADPHEEHGR